MKTKQSKPVVKLSGQDGNVFMLIGLCQRAARRAGWTDEEVKATTAYIREAQDYDGAIQRMMEKFEVE